MLKFKAKVYIDSNDGSKKIKVPRFKESHCDMNFFRSHHILGGYANSELFEGLLARYRRDIFGSTGILKLDNCPESVTIDTSKFLATVTIAEEAFLKQ